MSDHATIVGKVADYYEGKLSQHGPTHAGVDWNSEASQELRFRQLLKIADGLHSFSINDIGCGYGALAAFVGADVDYRGFDISPAMVAEARSQVPQATFTSNPGALTPATVSVASGIFNVRLDATIGDWEDYIRTELDRLAELSTRGFAFNMLTGFSDPERKRDDLYYADPGGWLEYCWRRFGRRAALLHDYGLWEFTLLIRLPE